MKFLIKCCFWFAVVVMIMPTDQQRQAKLYQTAEQAVGQAATFCDRYPGVCSRGAEVWQTFKVKAAFAAGLAMDIAMEAMFGERNKDTLNRQPLPVREGQQTLSKADRSVKWSGPVKQAATKQDDMARLLAR